MARFDWRLVGLFGAVLALGSVSACGDSGGDKKDATSATNEDGSADGDVVEVDPWIAPAETNAFRVLYDNRGRINTDLNELWLMDSDGENEEPLTELAKLADEDLSCNYGCIVSPDLVWIVVVTGPPTAGGGFSLKLGKFNADKEVHLLKGGDLTGIIDFHFAGDRMFYSRKKSCTGPSCTYDISVVQLDEDVNEETPFLTFPLDNELEGSTYKGHFEVSADGNNVVLLNTTIRSVDVYLFRFGTGLVELDYLCKFGDKNNCTGTGSEYSDTDPVAIDANGRYIAFFTFADKWQRVRLYDTENPAQIKSSIVGSVTTGAWISNACSDPNAIAEWQWKRVIGNPYFTPDGKEIVFIGVNDCPVDGVDPIKPQSNIYRIKLDTILSEKTLTADDVFNITRGPKGDVTANRVPDAFGLSPDGATVVFVGTPMFDQSGNAIPDGNARQRNDREVYRIRLDGSNVQQLTNDIEFSAEAPQVLSL